MEQVERSGRGEIIVVTIVLAFVAFAIIGSATDITLFWAMNRSIARANCYRAVGSIDACGEPNLLERGLRAVFLPAPKD